MNKQLEARIRRLESLISDIGINKEFNITNITDTSSTTIYYISK